MSPKRGYGSGSLRERRPGVWEVRAGRRSLTVHGGRKQAERELSKLVALVGVTRAVDTNRTFGELIDARLAIADIATRTRIAYEAALEHLPTNFRTRKTHSLTVADFDRLYHDLHRQGVGVPTIRKLHAVLSSACAEGLRWRWLDHHPARGARIPKTQRRTMRIPTQHEIRALVDTAASDVQLSAWLRVMLATGARRSEVLALRWTDLDLPAAEVTITHALDLDSTLKTTKTGRARSVKLDAATIDALATWAIQQAQIAHKADTTITPAAFVFSNAANGNTPWRPEGASQRFKRLCERANVGHIRVHDLRHAHASYLLALGHDLATISRRLGHADPSTTARIYAHALEATDQAAAESIGRMLDS